MLPISHSKEYGVYHWDTFVNETMLREEFDNLDGAIAYVERKYKSRISAVGADQVDIVDSKGNIVEKYTVT